MKAPWQISNLMHITMTVEGLDPLQRDFVGYVLPIPVAGK